MISTISRNLLLAVAILALAACSNLNEKRTLLVSSGFKTVPATTPAQLERLHSLKRGKVVPLTGKKGTVYVFADLANNALLVGSPAQYQQYRSLKLRHQQVEAKLLDAQVNMDDADYNAWGQGSSAWGWGVASDPL